MHGVKSGNWKSIYKYYPEVYSDIIKYYISHELRKFF